jgi:pimeloyl-ACP methyl ester carboxylesterase
MKHIIAIACALFVCAAQAAGPVASTEGKLTDGTPYRIDMPQHWNGAVLIGLDYAAKPRGPDAEALLAEGYAMAGTTRAVSGWAIQRAAANAIETLDLFEAKYGKAALPIELGQSQGGHTAAVSVQAYPARWRGAVVKCGGLSGTVGQWQAKLDGLFVAKVLLAPDSTLPVTGIPDDWQTRVLPAWTVMLEQAEKTPAGRARIAFAARVAQLPEWSDPAKPEPAAGELDARARGLADSLVRGLLRQAMSSRNQVEHLSGGNISANEGVDYGALLAAVDQDGLVRKLYREAGLSLDGDLAALARAPRLRADPKALAYVATGVFDGDIGIPVLTLNGLGDPISPPASQQFYQQAVERVGKGALLRQTYTHSAGHCGFTPAETVASVHALVTRIKSGQWPDTSPAGMTALAGATGLGESRFVPYTPPPFLRAYSACTLLGALKAAGVQPFALPGQALPRCVAP